MYVQHGSSMNTFDYGIANCWITVQLDENQEVCSDYPLRFNYSGQYSVTGSQPVKDYNDFERIINNFFGNGEIFDMLKKNWLYEAKKFFNSSQAIQKTYR